MSGGAEFRALHLVSDMHPRMGGPPRVAAGVTAALARAGHRPEIVALCHPSDREETLASWPELAAAGVPMHLFPYDRPAAFGRSRALNAFLRRSIARYDVLHIHTNWLLCAVDASRAARANEVPYVFNPHGALHPYSRDQSKLKKRLSIVYGAKKMWHGAAALQLATRQEADEISDLGLPAPVFIIPNGVETAALVRRAGEGGALLEQFPLLGDGDPVLLFYSRLDPKKGLDLLLAAFQRVSPSFPRARLLVAAIPQDVVYEREQRRVAGEPPLAYCVAFTTDFVGPAGILAINMADVLVQPSHTEGFAMSVLEGMGYGLPVLITEGCHLPQVEAEGAGFEVPATVAGIESGLRKMLERPAAELAAMGRRARSFVGRTYGWDGIARDTAAMYGSIAPR